MIVRERVAVPPYAEEVRQGLTNSPKSLPPKLFYDAAGSALFEEITRLPEYYLTRTELEILRQYAGDISRAAGTNLTVVELGAGTASKTSTLLHAVAAAQLRVTYVPVDISPAALEEARTRIGEQCPGVRIRPLVADFGEGFGFLRRIAGRKLVVYLGSSIGNFEPDAAIAMLAEVRRQLSAGDALLLGTDLVKDQAVLIPAYDDAQGVTAEFNKNILRRINRELRANFDVDAFRHIAVWNPARSGMQIYLESTRTQRVHIAALNVDIAVWSGERIHTENSYKYTLPMVRRMLESAGYKLEQTWFDRRIWFALHLARAERNL